MKKILVINPNSSLEMTQDIRNTIAYAINDSFSIEVTRMENSPNVLESFTDYTVAGAEVVKYIRELKIKHTVFPYDGIILACFGDPCLAAVKETSPVPVVGIAEAAMSIALLCGAKFSILASSAKAKPMMENLVVSYDLTARLASVETFSLPIEAFMEDKDLLRSSIKKTAEQAESKGAEVLLLGCAGMTMISNELDSITKVPAIDPIKAGIEEMKALLNGNFSISRAGIYA